MLKLYIAGVIILLSAILANMLAAALGLASWYDLFRLLNEHGTAGLRKLRLVDGFWLFLLYPLLLGLGWKAAEWLLMLLKAS